MPWPLLSNPSTPSNRHCRQPHLRPATARLLLLDHHHHHACPAVHRNAPHLLNTTIAKIPAIDLLEQINARRTPGNDRPAIIGPLNHLAAIDQDHPHHPVVIVDQGQDLPLRPAVVVDQGQDLPKHLVAIVDQGQGLPLRPAVVAQGPDLPPRLAAVAHQPHTEKRSANDLDPC